MRRRTFITSAAAAAGAVGAVGALGSARALAQGAGAAEDPGTRALAALNNARRLEASGEFEQLHQSYHSDAMVVEPAVLAPSLGRAAVVSNKSTIAQSRKLLYFYYRQPQVLFTGSAAIVISNYEAGHSVDGQTIEHTGKSSNVVLLGPDPPLIAMETSVPNLHAGSYGALGTALTKEQWGIYPLRALGPAAATGGNQDAGGGENDLLYKTVQQINSAWLSGNAQQLLSMANPSGVFLIGDYSPYFITGDADIKQHFADFYKTSRVNMIQSMDPQVRIWGSAASVFFNFDLNYTINGKTKHSPGRGVYTFAKGAPSIAMKSRPSSRSLTNVALVSSKTWAMVTCAASHLVSGTVGDPYPTPVG